MNTTTRSENNRFSKVDAPDEDDPFDYLRALARYLRGEIGRHDAAKKDIEIILVRISELLGQPSPRSGSGPGPSTAGETQSTSGKPEPAGQQSTAPSASKEAVKEELRSSEGLLLAIVEHQVGGKILVTPKVELPTENSTYSRFLKPKILTPLAAKYPQFRYRPIISNATVVGLEMQVTQEQWSELVKPLTWTFEKAERRQ